MLRGQTVSEHGSVIDNTEEQRFELPVDERVAFINYRIRGNAIVMAHTEVPEELEGQGIGSALVRGALDLARQRHLNVVPSCPFVSAYIRQHPEYLDLVSEQDRPRFNLG